MTEKNTYHFNNAWCHKVHSLNWNAWCHKDPLQAQLVHPICVNWKIKMKHVENYKRKLHCTNTVTCKGIRAPKCLNILLIELKCMIIVLYVSNELCVYKICMLTDYYPNYILFYIYDTHRDWICMKWMKKCR